MAWTDYYVDLAGAGTDSGTTTNPWLSYASAIAGIAAADADPVTKPTRVFVRGTSAALGGAIDFNTDGTQANPIYWVGCTGTGTTWTRIGNANSTSRTHQPCATYQVTVSGNFQHWEGLSFSGTTTTASGLLKVTGAGFNMVRCRTANTQANSASRAITLSGANWSIAASYFEATTTAGYVLLATAQAGAIFGCLFKGGDVGIAIASCPVVNCIFYGYAVSAIKNASSGPLWVFNCTTLGGSGAAVTGNDDEGLCANNLFVNCATPIEQTSGTDSIQPLCCFNAWYNVTNDYCDGLVEVGAGDDDECASFGNSGLLAGDPLPNSGAIGNVNDFDLAAAYRGLAFPGEMEGGAGYAYVGYASHGALQWKQTASALGLTAANLRYGVTVDDVSGDIQMPNSGSPTGTQDATSDACVVSGKKYGSPERTGSAAGGGGYTYGDNDATKVLTTATGAGTYQPVAASDVRYGTAVGVSPATGTCYVPAAGDVQFGVNVDATTGTFTSPAVGKVIDDTSWGAGGTEFTGTYHATAVAEVLDSVSFGAGSAQTGTYHAPDAAEVIHTAVFGPASGTAGTYHAPEASEVQKGATVGATVGTLVGVVDSGGTRHDYGTCSTTQAWAAAGIVHTSGTAAASGILNSSGTYAASGVFAGGAGTIYATTGLSVGQVLSTVATWRDGDGDHAGTYVQPVTGQVLAPAQGGTAFGPSSGTNGTLTFANTQYVLSSAPDYGIAGTGGAKTATIPLASTVLTGSGTYGVNGTSETPGYTPDFPAVSSVLTSDTVNGSQGTFNAANLSVGNVIQDVAFGVGLTGTGANLQATHTAYLSLEAGRNNDNGTVAADIVTTKSVKIRNATINGAATLESHTAGQVISTAGGTYDVSNVSAGNIRDGVSIGGVTGTFTHTAAYVAIAGLPAVGYVYLGTDRGDGNTGTLTLTAAGNVLTGTGAFGIGGTSVTPSYSPDFPDVGNVTTTDTVNGAAGTLDLSLYTLTSTVVATIDAAKAGILSSVTLYTVTGTYHAPEAAEVISTAVFGPASGTSGTYDVSNVAAGNIKDGVSIGGVTGNYSGTATIQVIGVRVK